MGSEKVKSQLRQNLQAQVGGVSPDKTLFEFCPSPHCLTSGSLALPSSDKGTVLANLSSFLFFLATLIGLWDLSTLTRNRTQVLGSESAEY